MIRKNIELFSLVFIALFMIAAADNPVACSISKVTGTWVFTFDTETISKSDKNWERMSCGRGQPAEVVGFLDVEDAQEKKLAHLKGYSDIDDLQLYEATLELTHEYNMIQQKDDQGQLTQTGEWTMVVHEGMLGFYFDEDYFKEEIVFDAFFRYNSIGDGKYESLCYETMIGWYHTSNPGDEDNEQWGCFYAKKQYLTAEEQKSENHLIFKNGSPELNPEGATSGGGQCSNNIKAKESDGTLSWFKNGNMGTATDPNFAAFTPNFGTDKNGNQVEVTRDNEGRLSELKEYEYLVGKNPNEIEISELPLALNWNNINGYSFYPEIISQGCGDCYLWAFKHATESRFMIRTNGKSHPKISIQHMKDCNFYIEGCDGGLPINVAKWGWEFGLAEEGEYKKAKANGDTNTPPVVFKETDEQATLANQKGVCKNTFLDSDEATRYMVKDFYYVGGNYGGVSEELLMKEVMAHGPVTAVLNAPSYLQQYKGCVLMQECKNAPGEVAVINEEQYTSRFEFRSGTSTENMMDGHMVNTNTLWENGVEWEMVNHSIVIVGWGKDDTCPNPSSPQVSSKLVVYQRDENGFCDPDQFDGSYWLIANSWGKEFGESGFFRLRRGCNDFGIETQALSIIPETECDGEVTSVPDFEYVTESDPYVCPLD